MTWVILDTSYLLEIYRVPGKHDPAAHSEITARLAAHIAGSGRIYVPIPVIFEFANHIADLADGGARFNLAAKLKETIHSSLETASPWIIMPFRQNDLLDEVTGALVDHCRHFAEQYAVQGVGLTDIALIDAANRLSKMAARQTPRASVHIWTRDVALKAREPDCEQDPFV